MTNVAYQDTKRITPQWSRTEGIGVCSFVTFDLSMETQDLGVAFEDIYVFCTETCVK